MNVYSFILPESYLYCTYQIKASYFCVLETLYGLWRVADNPYLLCQSFIVLALPGLLGGPRPLGLFPSLVYEQQQDTNVAC
jgi:hypothetical protein